MAKNPKIPRPVVLTEPTIKRLPTQARLATLLRPAAINMVNRQKLHRRLSTTSTHPTIGRQSRSTQTSPICLPTTSRPCENLRTPLGIRMIPLTNVIPMTRLAISKHTLGASNRIMKLPDWQLSHATRTHLQTHLKLCHKVPLSRKPNPGNPEARSFKQAKTHRVTKSGPQQA